MTTLSNNTNKLNTEAMLSNIFTFMEKKAEKNPEFKMALDAKNQIIEYGLSDEGALKMEKGHGLLGKKSIKKIKRKPREPTEKQPTYTGKVIDLD